MMAGALSVACRGEYRTRGLRVQCFDALSCPEKHVIAGGLGFVEKAEEAGPDCAEDK